MTKPKILAFAGSLRKDSLNKKLVKIAIEGAKEADAEVTYIDLKDFPMPLYDGDDEAANGLPEYAKKLKKIMIEHDAFLISSPEYNSSISAVLKNAIDWVSRQEKEDEGPGLAAFRNKTAALMSASPSYMGGLRGLVHIRSILGNIGVIVLPDQVFVPDGFNAFDDKGQLKDESKQKSVKKLGAELAKATAKLKM